MKIDLKDISSIQQLKKIYRNWRMGTDILKKEEQEEVEKLLSYTNISLGDCAQEKVGFEPMDITVNATADIYEDTTTTDKRRYLDNRLWSIFHRKNTELSVKYKITWLDEPKTPADLLERLKAGKYTVKGAEDPKTKDAPYEYFYIGNQLSFRSEPADQDGYDIARKSLDAAYQTAQDAVKILDPKDALAAVQAFENWTD